MDNRIDAPIRGAGKIKCLNPERTPYSIAIFVVDAESDVENIPEYTHLGNTVRTVVMGSACYVIETGEWWVKNGDKKWVKRMFDRFYLDLITQEMADRKNEDRALQDELTRHKNEVADGEIAGHVRLSDATDQDKGIHDGFAATPRAVKEVMDYAKGLLAANAAMVYKGAVSPNAALPAEGYKRGWTYIVAVKGSYCGQECEPGDMITAVKDWNGEASDQDWNVTQCNLNGAVIGPESSTDGSVAVFSGAGGKVIKCSPYTLKKSVPEDAVFTDTVYVHPMEPGYRHIPSGGTAGKYLVWEADGRAAWGDPPEGHTHANKETLDNVTQAVIDDSHSHPNKETLDKITDGDVTRWNAAAGGGGGKGDVTGPDSARDGNIAVFDRETGKLLKDGGAALYNADAPTFANVGGSSGGITFAKKYIGLSRGTADSDPPDNERVLECKVGIKGDVYIGAFSRPTLGHIGAIALGLDARADALDCVQLGEGTNAVAQTMKFRDFPVVLGQDGGHYLNGVGRTEKLKTTANEVVDAINELKDRLDGLINGDEVKY